jgi:hypothetical protein
MAWRRRDLSTGMVNTQKWQNQEGVRSSMYVRSHENRVSVDKDSEFYF